MDILLQPFQLLVAEIAESAGFEIDDIDEADKVHAIGVEAVPAGALGGAAIALAVHLLIGIKEVVFAWHIVHIKP